MTESSGRNRLLRVVLIGLAVIGIGASLKLTELHYTAHVNPHAESFCSINKAVNCLNVAESRYARLFGVPVSVWTLLTYLLLFTLALAPVARKGKGPGFVGFIFVIGAISVVGTIAMALISQLVIKTFCIVCAILYFVNPTILTVSLILAAREGGLRQELRADFAWLARPASNGLLAASFGLLIAVGLMVVYPKYWNMREPVGPGTLPHGLTKAGHPWIGAKRPILTIYELSDYECGFCRRANAKMRKLLAKREYSQVVRLVHINYPLDRRCNAGVDREFHQRACELARAAHCASKQGKAWHFHDMLFRRQRPGGPNLRSIMLKLELDIGKLETCMASSKTKQHIRDEIAEGDRLAHEATQRPVMGTPSFFFKGPDGKVRVGSLRDVHIRTFLAKYQAGPARPKAALQPR